MIAKIVRRKSFRRVVRYALKLQKNGSTSRLLASDLIDTTSRESMIKSFNGIANQRKDIKEAVWHTSLNLALNESLSDKEWTKLIKDFLKKMDLENHQFIAVKHINSKKREHVHLIVNRIDYYSEVWAGRQERKRAMQACRGLEIEYNLQRVTSDKRAKSMPSKNEIERAHRTGETIPKVFIQETIDKILAKMKFTKNNDIFQFIRFLEENEIYAMPNVANTGRMNGFSFYYNGFLTTGGNLGTDYNWTKLQYQLNYNQSTDSTRLLQEKERINKLIEKHAFDNNIQLEKASRKCAQRTQKSPKIKEENEFIEHNTGIRGKTRAKPYKSKKVKVYEEIPRYQTCFIEIDNKKQKSLEYKRKLFFDLYQNTLPKSFEDSYLRKQGHCTSFSFKDYFLEDFGAKILLSVKNKDDFKVAVSASLDLCLVKVGIWKI